MSNELGLSKELEEKIRKLMFYVNRVRENGELAIFNALFQTDFQIITYLNSHANAHPSDMADSIKVTRPNIAANLRLLEQKGYIVRNVDEDNRRQVYVNLTEKGREYYDICQKQLAYLFVGWFQILGEEDTDNLFRILEKSSSQDIMTEELKNFNFGE